MKNFKGVAIFLILISILVAAGCNQGTQEEVPDLGPIQMGYLPIIPFAPLYLGFEKGYFEEQGLDVELISFNSGAHMMPLLSTGDLDFGAGQIGTEFFNAIHLGLDVKIVGGQSTDKKGYSSSSILVRKDLWDSGAITKPADLKGATIGINVERGLSEYFIAKALNIGGLTLDDVTLITMPFPELVVALANSAVDVVHIVEPLAGKAVADGHAVKLINPNEMDDIAQFAALYFGKRLLEPENREVGIRILMVWLKGVRDLYGEGWTNEEYANITSSYTSVPPPAILHTPEMYFGPNGVYYQSSTENLMMYYMSQGYTDFSEPLDLSDGIDISMMKEAVERLGHFEE